MLEKEAYNNNKASIDTLYSERIAKALEGSEKNEETIAMITNAVEGKN